MRRGGAPTSGSAEATPRSAPPQQRAGPEPTAAAHGDEGVLAARALEFVDGLGDEQGARPPERVADGDRSTVGVHPGPVGLELLLNICAMLIVLIALVHLANSMLGMLPDVIGAPLTLRRKP